MAFPAQRIPLDESERLLLHHRVLTECVRLGGGSIIEIAGRSWPIAALADSLLDASTVPREVTDQARMAAAWCRVHGITTLSGILQGLADLHAQVSEGQECFATIDRLMRQVDAAAASDQLGAMASTLETLVDARRAPSVAVTAD